MAQSLLSSFFKKLTPEEVQESREKEKEVTIVKVVKSSKKKRGPGRPRKQPSTAGPICTTSSFGEEPGPSGVQAHSTSVKPAGESKGPPSKTIKTMYTDKQERAVATYARFHGKRQAARHFRVPRKNIQRWVKEDISILKARGTRKNKKGQGRKLSYPQEKEHELVQWLLEQRDYGIPIATQVLQKKAISTIQPYSATFAASDGWVRKFLRRNNLAHRAGTNFAQTLPKDLEHKIEVFRHELLEIRKQHDFRYELICNMDETPVYFDMVPGKSIDRKGSKTIRIRTTGGEKRHLTVVLACSSAGDILPTLIIFKGKRALKGLQVPSGLRVAVQEKAWMDEGLMLLWIKEVWQTYTKGRHALLVLDSFRAHLTNSVKVAFAKVNTTICVIPGGCTSVLQPLDVSLNKPFKACIRQSWSEYIQQQVQQIGEDIPPKPLKIPTAGKQDIINWIKDGCQYLKDNRAMTQKSFIVTGISNALGGYEDNMIRNEELRKEIDEVMMAIFGEDENDSDYDPLDTSTDDSSDDFTTESTDDDHRTTSESEMETLAVHN